MQSPQHMLAGNLGFQARVIANSVIDLVEELDVGNGGILNQRPRQLAEQRGLPVVNAPPSLKHQNAGRIVPAKSRGNDAHVEVATGRRAERGQRRLQADGPQLLADPRVDRRRADAVQAVPADGAILQRDRRIERPDSRLPTQ